MASTQILDHLDDVKRMLLCRPQAAAAPGGAHAAPEAGGAGSALQQAHEGFRSAWRNPTIEALSAEMRRDGIDTDEVDALLERTVEQALSRARRGGLTERVALVLALGGMPEIEDLIG